MPGGVVGGAIVGPIPDSQRGCDLIELLADETNDCDIGLKVIGYMSKDVSQKLGRYGCDARHDCMIEMVSRVSDPKRRRNLVTLCWLRLALRLLCLCSLNLRQFFWQSGDGEGCVGRVSARCWR